MRDEAASTVDGDALTAKSQSPLELLASEAFHVASIVHPLVDDDDMIRNKCRFQTPSPNVQFRNKPKADQTTAGKYTESEDGSVGLVESPAMQNPNKFGSDHN
ncbi:expressed unknown protein [Seminavis robusta]|uniref:Uncharacterized protein n=1 Tax=Seminavis robusta TaxID=568900 RepID=A0A9N8ETA3_9STRA|nr:expressed unknown protein [Seminavis robusta]|eukprot:Sro1625_g286800.1 n/a (103) ;mRNA; r:22242-22550